jgi:hypothetical protein
VSSPLRDRLRTRLLEARRARDNAVAAALRSAISALENAEAVEPASETVVATSDHVAGGRVGLGAAEAERRELDEPAERAIVAAEIADLTEGAAHYATAGDGERAAAARQAAGVLAGLLDPPTD